MRFRLQHGSRPGSEHPRDRKTACRTSVSPVRWLVRFQVGCSRAIVVAFEHLMRCIQLRRYGLLRIVIRPTVSNLKASLDRTSHPRIARNQPTRLSPTSTFFFGLHTYHAEYRPRRPNQTSPSNTDVIQTQPLVVHEVARPTPPAVDLLSK